MSSQPKRHHYLAEAYLRRFTDESGNLWVLDRKLGVVRRQSPEVTAAEHEMYSHDGADGSRDRRAELLLADLVDGPGQSPLKVLHEGGQLTQEQYRPLATFVASLHVRTPAFREQNRKTWEELRELLEEAGVEPAVPSAAPSPESERIRATGGMPADELLAGLQEAGNQKRPYQNDFVQMMVPLIPQIAEALSSLKWVFMSAPAGKSFITSDLPLVLTAPPGHHELLGVGLTTPGSVKVVPLTSRVALMMLDVSPSRERWKGIMHPDRVRALNESLVRQCERFAMSRSRPLLDSLLRATGVGRTAPPRRSEIAGWRGRGVRTGRDPAAS